MGVQKGAPDLFISIPNAYHHGMYVEMKSDDGVVAKHQKEYHEILREQNYYVDVCWSVDEAIESISGYMCSWSKKR